MEALLSVLDCILLASESERELETAGSVQFDRMEHIHEIHHSVPPEPGHNSCQYFVVLVYHSGYERGYSVQGSEVDRNSPGNSVGLEVWPKQSVADRLHGSDDVPLQEALDGLSYSVFCLG